VIERLATCVNRVPGLQSSYVWSGQLQNESEILLMIKTIAARIRNLRRAQGLHL